MKISLIALVIAAYRSRSPQALLRRRTRLPKMCCGRVALRRTEGLKA